MVKQTNKFFKKTNIPQIPPQTPNKTPNTTRKKTWSNPPNFHFVYISSYIQNASCSAQLSFKLNTPSYTKKTTKPTRPKPWQMFAEAYLLVKSSDSLQCWQDLICIIFIRFFALFNNHIVRYPKQCMLSKLGNLI